jgi:protein-tyrosine phosphatase
MGVILFVCTGNLCRSPMATGLLRKRLADEGLDGRYQVMSAGVQAVEGRPASRNAAIVMAMHYVDITEHIAHTITADDVEKATLILTADEQQAEMIRQTWTHHAWKVHRLSEMAGKSQDIKDPYRRSLEKYEACADTIARFIEEGFERILELA